MTAVEGSLRHPRLPPGWHLLSHEVLASTNDEARALAEAGARRTIVWARRQERGRARRGRGWDSPAGNLYCSAILGPRCPAAEAGQLAFVVALALAEAVEALAPGLAVRLKWPNDLLIDTRKAAGILMEAGTGPGGIADWVIAGTGLNLASHPQGTAFPATSLSACGATVTPEAALTAYAAALDRRVASWAAEGFGPQREAWLARALGLEGPIEVRLDREVLAGTFADLDRDGALILARPGAPARRITAGDVFFPGA